MNFEIRFFKQYEKFIIRTLLIQWSIEKPLSFKPDSISNSLAITGMHLVITVTLKFLINKFFH